MVGFKAHFAPGACGYGDDDWNRTSLFGVAAHCLTTRPRRLGSPGWFRTSNLLVNSQAFYQLNYGRMEAPVRVELTYPGSEPGALPLSYGAMAERAGFEPANPFEAAA